ELVAEERLEAFARVRDHLPHRGLAEDRLQELLIEEARRRHDPDLGAGYPGGMREDSDHRRDRERVHTQRDAESEVARSGAASLHVGRDACHPLVTAWPNA